MKSKAADPYPTNWLTTFEINVTSASPQHYANGKQQVEIILSVKARESLLVTEAQLASLCIVERTDAGKFVPLPTEPTSGNWWVTDQRNIYDYFQPAGLNQNDLSTDVQLTTHTHTDNTHFHESDLLNKRFYAMTSASGGTTKKLWAQITKTPEEIYVTNFEFVTDVTLVAVAPPQHSAATDYSLNRRLISGSESSGMFIYEWIIFPFGLKLLTAIMSPTGMIQWQDKTSEETKASYVAFAGPKESNFEHNDAIVTGDYFVTNERADTVSSPNTDKIIVLLQGSLHIPYHSTSANTQNGPCTITAADSQGNEHLIKIKFTAPSGFEGRTHLELEDAQ